MNSRIWPIDYKPMGHTFIVNTLRVVMPDLTRALIGYSPE
jgi:hypothetical protein